MEQITMQAMLVISIVSGLPLIVSTLLGLFIAVIQTALQVQEQSLSFLIKFISASGILFICADWFKRLIIELFQLSLGGIVYIR